MRKYIGWFALFFVLSVLVTSEHDKRIDDSASPNSESGVLTAAQSQKARINAQSSKWYAPGWSLIYELFGWPAGITIWALFLTLAAVAEQTRETGKAASAALAQIQMTKAKERARLEIKGSNLGLLQKNSEGPWVLCGYLSVRNTGSSKAYIVKSGGGIDFADRERWPLPIDETPSLDWPSVIDPNTNRSIQTLRNHSGTHEEFAKAINSRKVIVYLQAFVEYESLGTIWHKDIGFIWLPDSKEPPFVTTIYGNPNPSKQLVTHGCWAFTPKLRNGEYEVQQALKRN